MDEAISVVGFAGLRLCLHGSKRLVAPLGEPAGRDAGLPAEGINHLVAEEPSTARCAVVSSLCRALCPRFRNRCLRKLCSAP